MKIFITIIGLSLLIADATSAETWGIRQEKNSAWLTNNFVTEGMVKADVRLSWYSMKMADDDVCHTEIQIRLYSPWPFKIQHGTNAWMSVEGKVSNLANNATDKVQRSWIENGTSRNELWLSYTVSSDFIKSIASARTNVLLAIQGENDSFIAHLDSSNLAAFKAFVASVGKRIDEPHYAFAPGNP